jgi:hypothetical protein
LPAGTVAIRVPFDSQNAASTSAAELVAYTMWRTVSTALPLAALVSPTGL